MHINLAWPDQFVLDGFHWNWNNSFTAKVCLHVSFFDVWTVVGLGKMQFKPGFYANRMYTVCHAVAYSSSRNIYCFVLSELYNFLSLYTCLYMFDRNEIIGEDNNFVDHLLCQNVSRQLLKVWNSFILFWFLSMLALKMMETLWKVWMN